MPHRSQNREILFTISDVGRLLRTYADQKARQFGHDPGAVGGAAPAGTA